MIVKKKEKVVYILGAGASKDFGLPLANEFFALGKRLIKKMNDAHQSKKVLNDCITNLLHKLPTIYPNLSADMNLWPNIEEILTLSHLQGHVDLFNETLRYLGFVLASAQSAPFINTLYPEMYQPGDKFSDRYSKLLDFIKKILSPVEEEVAFISFNYDILLDSILGGVAIELAPIRQPKIIEDYSYGVKVFNIHHKQVPIFNPIEPCRISGPLLLKPHGSINLVYCPNCKKIYYAKHSLIYAWSNQSFYLKCCDRFAFPLIIPPLYGKGKAENLPPLLMDYIKTVLDRMRAVISEADRIVVIGYSFPNYDIEIKSLILEEIRRNKKVRWKIIDNGDSIEKALQNIANKDAEIYDNGFMNYIKGINASPNP